MGKQERTINMSYEKIKAQVGEHFFPDVEFWGEEIINEYYGGDYIVWYSVNPKYQDRAVVTDDSGKMNPIDISKYRISLDFYRFVSKSGNHSYANFINTCIDEHFKTKGPWWDREPMRWPGKTYKSTEKLIEKYA